MSDIIANAMEEKVIDDAKKAAEKYLAQFEDYEQRAEQAAEEFIANTSVEDEEKKRLKEMFIYQFVEYVKTNI